MPFRLFPGNNQGLTALREIGSEAEPGSGASTRKRGLLTLTSGGSVADQDH